MQKKRADVSTHGIRKRKMFKHILLLLVLISAVVAFSPISNVIRSSVRGNTIVMDGKTRVLRDRIKSVKNTRRITEAMRLVAAARVRRAQEAVLKTRPLLSQLQLVYKTVLDACNQEEIDLPILEVRDVKTVGLVLVTGDRGLCGSYNSAVIKSATKRIQKLNSQGINVQLILVGRKGEQWFVKRPTPVAATFLLGNIPQPAVGSQLSNLLIAKFLAAEIDAAEIIYTRFNNLISSEPSIRTLLPLSLTGIESEEDEVFKVTTKDGKMIMQKQPAEGTPTSMPDYIFEDEPAQILSTMLTLYFSATVMRCMQESVASELAARMTAMQSASNNAKKIVNTLSQVYNRARQATITQELLEVVAGASALADS
jgi:F-type H+-transporting ATPase subunit gamma